MPAPRLSAQEYIQQLRAKRAEKTAPAAASTPTTPALTPVAPPMTPEPAPNPPAPAAAPPPATNTPPAPDTTTATNDDVASQQVAPVEKVVLEWKAPNRPYKKRDRRYYITVGTIVFLISLILFFAGQFLPIAVVISVAFLSYVLTAVPPIIINHQLTNFGLRIDDELYYWPEMGRFWFTKKFGQPLLNIELDRFPWRLGVLLGDLPQDKMGEMFGVVLFQEQPKPSAYEKAATWVQKMIPLDNEPEATSTVAEVAPQTV